MRFELAAGLIGVLVVAGLFFAVVRLMLGGWSSCSGRVERLFGGKRQSRGGNRVRCPNEKCGTANRADARFCARCGQRIRGGRAVENCDVTA
ncbi:MAG: hypothetical protein ACE5GE_08300 [Phycisphaerae bacterium]